MLAQIYMDAFCRPGAIRETPVVQEASVEKRNKTDNCLLYIGWYSFNLV